MISLDFFFNARGLFWRFNIGSEQSLIFPVARAPPPAA